MRSLPDLHKAFLRSSGACTDTRQLLAGSMFFALKGPSFDANAFAAQALAGGCAFVVVDDPQVVRDERYQLVPDVLKALQALGRHHRRQFRIPVIAITGTNGKTTTKELVHAVLSADRATLATSGNLNNHIGVPLTLLRLTAEHRIAIVEMGANHVGDIHELVTIAEPTHGLITNIGRAHLEGFGSYEGVITAKTEMYGFLRANKGTLFVNADDPLLLERSAGTARVTYGQGRDADMSGEAIRTADPFLHVRFRSRDGSSHHDVATRLIGDYNFPNVLCALSIGRHFGVSDQQMVGAIARYSPTNNRSQFVDTGRNQVVMDAYNANPSSMRAALENFAALPSERPKLVLLGGMKELGAESRAEHEAVIRLARDLGLDAMFVGPEFMDLAEADMRVFPSAVEALAALHTAALSAQLILVKGSRGTRLETVLPAL